MHRHHITPLADDEVIGGDSLVFLLYVFEHFVQSINWQLAEQISCFQVVCVDGVCSRRLMIAEEMELAVLEICLLGHFHLPLACALKAECNVGFTCFRIECVHVPDSIYVIEDAV
jgi:hypothetical protein